MNLTQNDRIKQVTSDTLIVGEKCFLKFHRSNGRGCGLFAFRTL